jgi:hypothetical protein
MEWAQTARVGSSVPVVARPQTLFQRGSLFVRRGWDTRRQRLALAADGARRGPDCRRRSESRCCLLSGRSSHAIHPRGKVLKTQLCRRRLAGTTA